MKKTFLRYGLYGGVAMVIFSILDVTVFSGFDNISEILGYVSIVLSLVFIYFGLRYYRDKHNGGTLSFGQGIKLGLLITLIPALCFGLADEIYVTWVNPHFYEQYTQQMLDNLKTTVPPNEYAAKAAGIKKQGEFFAIPGMDFLLMFTTVAAIGLVITVISTFALKRNSRPKTGLQSA
ncbi:MAG TPA: DUF4199 domain-containing protein [Chitinophagaceae bacterium]|nr:DUF4199 domain-containing protein [Chitinophagaceae bacterium]